MIDCRDETNETCNAGAQKRLAAKERRLRPVVAKDNAAEGNLDGFSVEEWGL